MDVDIRPLNYVVYLVSRAMANVTATADMDKMVFECRVFFTRDEGDTEEPPRHEDVCVSWYEVERKCTSSNLYLQNCNYLGSDPKMCLWVLYVSECFRDGFWPFSTPKYRVKMTAK